MDKKTVTLIAITFLYLLSPVDIVPDLVPMLGTVDDAGVVGLLVRHLISLQQGETSQVG